MSSPQRFVFERLLGFFLRNDRPFPYTVAAMCRNTSASRSTVFRALNRLETLRIIKRQGLGRNMRFSRGSMLSKIITIVSNRTNLTMSKVCSSVSRSCKELLNRVMPGYLKTSDLRKRKEREYFYDPDYQEYAATLKTDKLLGFISKKTEQLDYDTWKKLQKV